MFDNGTKKHVKKKGYVHVTSLVNIHQVGARLKEVTGLKV